MMAYDDVISDLLISLVLDHCVSAPWSWPWPWWFTTFYNITGLKG